MNAPITAYYCTLCGSTVVLQSNELEKMLFCKCKKETTKHRNVKFKGKPDPAVVKPVVAEEVPAVVEPPKVQNQTKLDVSVGEVKGKAAK